MICGSARKPEGESVNEKDPKCRQKCDLRRTPEGVSDSGSFYHAHAADPVSGNGIIINKPKVYEYKNEYESPHMYCSIDFYFVNSKCICTE